ncbi:hypothetical protein EDB19DRAFT_1835545 [Suillus lakei]|nr:hypothetical protein EDB19DRAFT_1835545 [Suillus lakei]
MYGKETMSTVFDYYGEMMSCKAAAGMFMTPGSWWKSPDTLGWEESANIMGNFLFLLPSTLGSRWGGKVNWNWTYQRRSSDQCEKGIGTATKSTSLETKGPDESKNVEVDPGNTMTERKVVQRLPMIREAKYELIMHQWGRMDIGRTWVDDFLRPRMRDGCHQKSLGVPDGTESVLQQTEIVIANAVPVGPDLGSHAPHSH